MDFSLKASGFFLDLLSLQAEVNQLEDGKHPVKPEHPRFLLRDNSFLFPLQTLMLWFFSVHFMFHELNLQIVSLWEDFL